tara:strand:+ start:12 stop:413 length:402 start_codon:yes stop_codon:yes gene_type:complete
MVPQLNYGVSLKTLLVVTGTLLFLTGCSLIPEPEVKIVTQIEKTTVPIAARPKPVDLVDTRVYVVTKENYDAFVEEFTAEHGELAYVVLSMKDYENLALNIADLRRFLEQQNEIIVYYEDALKPEEENTPSSK